MSLVLTLAIKTVDQRVVSPLLCGSHPYPYGSLTYRFSTITILLFGRIVNLFLSLEINFKNILIYFGNTSAIREQISSTMVSGAATFKRA